MHGLKLREFAHLGINDRIGEVVRIHSPHERFSAIEIQPFHLELPRIVEVDRFLVQASSARTGNRPRR